LGSAGAIAVNTRAVCAADDDEVLLGEVPLDSLRTLRHGGRQCRLERVAIKRVPVEGQGELACPFKV